MKVTIELTTEAQATFTDADLAKIVNQAAAFAESLPHWSPGKSWEQPVTKKGKAFIAALDYMPEGEYKLIVCQRHELRFLPNAPHDGQNRVSGRMSIPR